VRGETLRDVAEAPRGAGEWPVHYVVTDAGAYEYTGQEFVAAVPGEDATAVPLGGCGGGVIRDVRGDGESAVIVLESGDVVVFELQHDMSGPEPQAWPVVRCSPAAEAATWRRELDDMDRL
jgi:hypothetical protein